MNSFRVVTNVLHRFRPLLPIQSSRFFSSEQCRILGIETSCDDTGVAIVDEEGSILGECLYSQQEVHAELGGIIPPIARDLHNENMDKAIEETLTRASLKLVELDAIAATVKPGLPMSLKVGMECGKKLSRLAKIPFIPIHHMEAHAMTVRMVEKVDFPFLVLLISGGHCLIAVAEGVGQFILIGKSFDDAPGEAMDKISRRLKMQNLEKYTGMSGGKAIETAALNGDPYSFHISEPLLHNKDCNFSFAGIKNSVRKVILHEEEAHNIEGDGVLPNLNDLCASVQLGVAKHLIRRLLRAMSFCHLQNYIPENNQHLVVSGGVACNGFIKKAIFSLCETQNYYCHVPPPHLCTDNGVMIAWNGVEKWKAQKDIYSFNDLDQIDIEGKSPLGRDMTEAVSECSLKISWASMKTVFPGRAS